MDTSEEDYFSNLPEDLAARSPVSYDRIVRNGSLKWGQRLKYGFTQTA